MKHLRRRLQLIAAFLIVNLLANVIVPNVAFALTSGPTAPEYTSFEPVDTTDMVNLATGDLVYNLPLLEVPGPAGGYPLSLSYHAGIMPNEEASWVGLGWTLNTGAITRTVNGYPDDQYGAVRTRHDYVNGGSTSTFSVGIGVGGASFGLSFSNDTYQGFGMGSSFTIGVGKSADGVGIGLNGTVGTDGYGNNYAGLGVGLTVGKSGEGVKGLSTSVGVSTNFNSVSLNGGISYAQNGDSKTGVKGSSQSLVGGSISSKGLKPSATIAGISASQHNSKANNWTFNSSGFSVPVPLPGPFLLTLGYKYLRYYVDETSEVSVIGVNHADMTFDHDYDDWSFDSYALTGSVWTNTTLSPEKYRGGSFPAYDAYNVTGQGLSGSIRPVFTSVGQLMRQNLKDGDDYEIEYIMSGDELKKPHFRFLNDFSNSLVYDDDAILITSNFNTYKADEEIGVEYSSDKLTGSKNIETYTNEEIHDGDAFLDGFIDYQEYADRRVTFNGDISDQIGGYKITNESGVTYHYALPVYSYNEYSRNENSDEGIYTEYFHPDPYAYTWLLTAITGPDFVDRGGESNGANGILDSDDWGYWVKFDYGKWTDQYAWRNPVVDAREDLDSDYEMYSEGLKELYYLDAIQTKTHTALFVKDIRDDAKSSLRFLRNLTYADKAGETLESEEVTARSKEGGYYPEGLSSKTFEGNKNTNEGYYVSTLSYVAKPVSTLKLKSIILVKNDDLTIDKSLGSEWSQSINVKDVRIEYDEYGEVICERYIDELTGDEDGCKYDDDGNKIPKKVITYETIDQHLPENVFDIYDYAELAEEVEGTIIRQIDFDTDYGLMQNTPNSFPSSLLQGEDADISTTASDYEEQLLGKLTLNEIAFKGKEGASVTPPMKFYYDKNPDWTEDFYDIWGFYKSDYEDLGDENLSRMVTSESAEDVDAWSLSSISTSLGANINIEYESDSYTKPVLYKNSILSIESVSGNKVSFNSDYPNLSSFLQVGNTVDLVVMVQWDQEVDVSSCETTAEREIEQVQALGQYKQVEIESIVDNDSDKYILLSEDVETEAESTVSGLCLLCPDAIAVPNAISFSGILSGNCNYTSDDGIISIPYTETSHDYDLINTNPQLAAGNMSVTNDIEQYGGGVRVSSISIESLDKIHSTNYDYVDDQGYTSGVTSYEPFGLNNVQYMVDDVSEEDKLEYQELLNEYFYNLLLIAREVPAPGVVYEAVTVTEEADGVEVPGKVVYDFQVFEEGFVTRKALGSVTNVITQTCDCEEIEASCGSDGSGSSPCPYYSCDIWLAACDGTLDGVDNYTVTYEDNVIITYDGGETRVTPMTIKDYSTRVGNLKSVKTYGANDQLLTATSTNYLWSENLVTSTTEEEELTNWDQTNSAYRQVLSEKFNNQGVLQEMFTEYRVVDGSKDLKVFSRKEYYPSVVVGTTTTNYKTGITKETRNLSFDFLSGEVTSSYSDDGYGNQYVSKTVPAYHFYDDMGPIDNGGKNMLTQEGASYSYLMSSEFDPDDFVYAQEVKSSATGLLGASMQTWSKAIASIDGDTRYDDPVADIIDRLYRKESSYSHIGLSDVDLLSDGSYPIASFSELDAEGDWQSQLEGEDWQQNSMITLYDIHSHALEAQDINGNYAATRFDSNQERVIATVANAHYDEFVHKNFEDESVFNEGYSDLLTYSYTYENKLVDYAHSGARVFSATNFGEVLFDVEGLLELENSALSYQLSYWTTDPSVVYPVLNVDNAGFENLDEQNGTSKSVEIEGETWYLQVATFTIDDDDDEFQVGIKGDDSFELDDFRVHPIDATMTSYTYNSYGELSDILDANNLFTHYEYDAMGRLESVTRETLSYGPVETSSAVIHYGSLEAMENISGSLSVGYNTSGGAVFTFAFSQQSEGDYSYDWQVNGVSISGDEQATYAHKASGDYDVTVKVTNTSTGQVFSLHKNVSLSLCLSVGTIVSSECVVGSDGCYTGMVYNTYALGDCETETVLETASSTQCQNLTDPDGDVQCIAIE